MAHFNGNLLQECFGFGPGLVQIESKILGLKFEEESEIRENGGGLTLGNGYLREMERKSSGSKLAGGQEKTG